MATFSTQSGLQEVSGNFPSADLGVDQRVFGERVGLIGKLFGCRHGEISRPFSQDKISYRSCLRCGARKQFDSQTLKTFGDFYFPPVVGSGNKI